jgi:hypothetical protein
MMSVIKLAENHFTADEVTKRVGSLLTDWNRKKLNDPLMGAFDRNRILSDHESQFVTAKFKKWAGDASTGGAAPATLFVEPTISAEKQAVQLKKEMNATITELKRAHQVELENAAAAAAERILEVENMASEAKVESERVRRNAESRHNTALNKLNAELQKQAADKLTELAELKKTHQTAMAEVQTTHRALLEAAKSGSSSVHADFTAAMQRQREEHETTIRDMQAAQKRALAAKNGGVAELQESHEQMIGELKAAQNRILAAKQAELEAFESKKMQDLQDLDAQWSRKMTAECQKYTVLEANHLLKMTDLTDAHRMDSEAMVQENADLTSKCAEQAAMIDIYNRKWYRNLPSEYDLVNMVSNVFAGFGLWNMFGYIGLMVSIILIFIFKGINKDMKNGNSTADVYALTGVIAIESVYGYVHYVFFSDTLKAKEHLGFDYGTVAFIFAFLLSAGSFYAAFMTRNRTTDAAEI